MFTRSAARPASGRPVAEKRLAFAALALAGVLWGTSFLLGKVALTELGPTTLILYRFALASAVLLPLVRWSGVPLGLPEWRLVLLGALLAGPLMFVMQFEGLARTTAASAALLVAVAPPLLAIGAAVVDREWPGRVTWAAVALSSVGALALVGGPGGGGALLGDALCLLSMVAAVGWTLVSRRLGRRIGAWPATALQFAVGAVLLVPLALWRDGAPPLVLSAPVAGAVLALGLACTALTFGLWNWAVLRVEAAQAGVIANLEPLVGAVLGVALLGETVGGWAVLGGALLLGAAYLTTRAEARARGTLGAERPVAPAAAPAAVAPPP
ncbi:MAG: DMT family transporter [Rubricoccaceae bacterium]